ncbi:hypothetical protein N8910_01440 [Candidatus Pelagibacter ubique]|nr:hypothetical protein [Candidatus Pelagibacter ubique]
MYNEKKNIVDFRGPRKKTKNLSKKKKFEVFSEIRMPKLLNSMRSVRNLSNLDYYEYTDVEKKKIMKDFKEGYRDMLRAWENAEKKNKINKKRSYWDQQDKN